MAKSFTCDDLLSHDIEVLLILRSCKQHNITYIYIYEYMIQKKKCYIEFIYLTMLLKETMIDMNMLSSDEVYIMYVLIDMILVL